MTKVDNEKGTKVISLQRWKIQHLPRLACRGREAFFTQAPFSLEKAVRITKLPLDRPLYRGVFDGNGNLKLLEVYDVNGKINRVDLYANHLTEEELCSLKEQARNAHLPYVIIEVNSSTIRTISYDSRGQFLGESTDYFSPKKLGESTVVSPGMTTIRKTIFSSSGEPLVEEVYKEGNLLDVVDIRRPFERQRYFLPYEGIRVAYRLGFDNWEELQEIVQKHSGQVELALPYNIGYFNRTLRSRVQEVLTILESSKLEVFTLHAVQSPINQEDFLDWGEIVLQVADALGAETVTFHPNNLKPDAPREKEQQKALAMIQELQRKHKTMIAVETFAGSNRLFRPEDLVRYKIPIVLDVAHIEHNESLDLIKHHCDLIRTIHLSEKGQEKGIHHLPVDRFCLDVLEHAMEVGWRGNVVLEYLPKYKDLITKDQKNLMAFLKQPN